MERGQLLSIKRKISQGQLSDVLEEILNEGRILPDELIISILEAIKEGQLLDSRTLGRLVILTRDRDLFLMPGPRKSMLSDYSVLSMLLEAGIPDKAIEQGLCEKLALDFENNQYGLRQFILESLRDYGTISSLETLEAIEYDFFSRYKLAETILNGQQDSSPALSTEFAEHLERKTDVFLGELLKETIKAVRQRNDLGDDLWGLLYKKGDPFDRAVKYRNKSNEQLEDQEDQEDLGSSLNSLRKATEAMLKTVIELEKINPDKGEPVNKMQLPTLMAILMDKKYGRTPDKTYHKYLEQLRDNTTTGSHDQGEETEFFFKVEIVKGQIELFDTVLKYFRKYIDKSTAIEEQL